MNKYTLYISFILNGILLMILFGIVPFLLYFSILVNLGLVWYIKKTLQKTEDLEKDVTDVVEKIDMFSEHIENIHQLEMYYGDENLQNLIDHSRGLINDFIDFQEKYFDVEVQSETDEEETTEEEE
tara:strand:- start:165 stop:542 length:378 start_codon:yes stop_codon:yes gene_type:complete